MGQAITSVPQMVHYAGDLRRGAKDAATPDLSNKLQTAAKQLETQAFAQVGATSPNIGKLLDLIA